MQIDEKLALAARRGKRRGLKWEVTAKEREEYKEKLKVLNLGLEDRLTAKVGLLSGGQRQTLTLLMTTLVKPKVLLLDEHTAALDPKTAEKVLNATDRIVAEGKLTTIMMNDGKVVLDIKGEEKKKTDDFQIKEVVSFFVYSKSCRYSP